MMIMNGMILIKLVYAGDRFSEGLENILYLNPLTHSLFQTNAKDDMFYLIDSNISFRLNGYYQFETNHPLIPKTIKDWFDLQKQYEQKLIDENEFYALETKVTLKMPDPDGKWFKVVGVGSVVLNKEGLTYHGNIEEEQVDFLFRLENMPSIPFGAGENFEVYHHGQFYSFFPDDPKTAVRFSIAGEILYETYILGAKKFMSQDQILKINKRSFLIVLAVLFTTMIGAYILTFVWGNGYSFFKFIISPVLVLTSSDSVSIIVIGLFILILGGAFNIIDKTGGIKAIISSIVSRFKTRKMMLMSIITLFFMLFGALFGIFEESVTLLPMIIMLSLSLGWDTYTGLGMCLLAAGFGFS